MSKLHNYMIIDFETGGLSSQKNPVTEVGVAALSWDLKDLDEYSSLVKPYREDLTYDKGAEIATGISKKMCEEQGQDIKKVVEELISIAKKLKSGRYKPVVVGHNLEKFDVGFLIQIFEFCNKKVEDYFDTHVEDTLWYAEISWPEKSTHTLQASCSYQQVQLVDAHRALNDCKATRSLYKGFLEKLRGSGTQNSYSPNVERFRTNFQIQ